MRLYKVKGSKRLRSRKSNGRFSKTTLRDLGFSESDFGDGGIKVCASCNTDGGRPILKLWVCTNCGHENGGE